MMGTIVEITGQDKFAIDAAFEEIKKIESIANNFNPDSEISRLNQNSLIKASADLLAMVKESLNFCKLSDGAFDITINPLLALWKDRIKRFQDEKGSPVNLPTHEEIKDKLRLIGSDKIALDENKSLITFSQPGMSIDLGAIAKGYAVDKAIARLKASGMNSAMVNAGGNIYCLGKKGSRKWRIGIRHPRKSEEILYHLDLENQAVSTSGDYEQYFIANGRRYSHIIDPRTGYPADNGVVSVTIIAETATQADGLSTAVFVLGKENGQKLIEKTGGGIELKIVEASELISSLVKYANQL